MFGRTTLANCTVVDNSAGIGSAWSTYYGQGRPTSRLVLQNSIIWHNGSQPWSSRVWNVYNPTIPPDDGRTIAFSCIQYYWRANGVLISDPMFVDAANGDYRLQPNSPCIDAGDPSSPLDPDSSRADMGAFPSPYGKPVSVRAPGPPESSALSQNVPNPFNPSTTIRFALPQAGPVSLTIYDVNGRRVRTLVDGRAEAGPHSLVWDGRDALAREVASGVYLYRLTIAEGVLVRKMLMVR